MFALYAELEMKTVKKQTQFIKSTMIALLVLFSLTPCTVKAFALDLVDVTYERPINPSKTTVQESQCDSFELQEVNTVELNENQLSDVTNFPVKSIDNVYSSTLTRAKYSYNSQKISSDLPPKYILFKRLKLALA